MKKIAAISGFVLTATVMFCISAVPVTALEAAQTEISLISADSGYKIRVPGFIGLKTITAGSGEITAVTVETPVKDSDGRYPVFEILTADPKAYSVKSAPGILGEGQSGSFQGNFAGGRLLYAPKFSFGKELKDFAGDKIFSFNFDVCDKDGNKVFSVADMNFTFVNVSAKPAGSKILVDGKAVAFEAYTINGSNYFKLRDLAMALNGTDKQFQVEWDNAGNIINLTSKTAYTPVGNELAASKDTSAKTTAPTGSKIRLDGKEVGLKAYCIGGNNYFKLRDIGEILDFGVTWDEKENVIRIVTTTGYAG